MTASTRTAAPCSAAKRAAVELCRDRLDDALDDVFVALATMADGVEDAWRQRDGVPFVRDDISGFQAAIFEQLDAMPAFDSAGYAMVEGTLSDCRRHLEWWNRSSADTYQPLILNVEVGAHDPSLGDFYDYYAKRWFLAAFEHRRYVDGPFIDLPCADIFICTFSVPIVADGQLLGIAGADVAVSRFESELLPPLRSLASPAVLINAERRVVTSNDPSWISGEKLSTMPSPGADDWIAVAPISDIGWTLAVAR